MAKNDKKPRRISDIKQIKALQKLFGDTIKLATSSDTTNRDSELERIVDEVDSIVSADLEEITDLKNKDANTFFHRLFRNDSTGKSMSLEDIFEDEENGIFGQFQKRYANQNILFEDLHVITSQMHEIQEAINVTRDAIVTADDLSNNVSRSISFEGVSDKDTELQSYIGQIHNIEKQYKLLTKIKNHIVPNTLKYGKYYVYTVPYDVIFQQHLEKQNKSKTTTKRNSGKDAMMTGKITESATVGEFAEFEKKVTVFENASFVKDIVKGADPSVSVMHLDSSKGSELLASINEAASSISVIEEEIAIPLLEGDVDVAAYAEYKLGSKEKEDKFMKELAAKQKENETFAADGVKDLNKKDSDFSGIVKDCYVKLIDPRKIIPVKIMEEVIGYYYVHEEQVMRTRSPFTSNMRVDLTTLQTRKVETDIIGEIVDRVVKQFDKSFLQKNIKFRDLILNSVLYSDIYRKNIKFQFIPAEYITEFKVNEDESGEGRSIIMDSLFYAKLYLAILIFKMITIIARSNDQRVYYVRSSGIDTDVAGKIQDIARQLKQREFNFTDLLNYNSIMTKVGAGKDIFMPVGPENERGLEFDVIQGQDVQLNTEFMETLKTAAINATGVPSVIMQFINEADYAKTLQMGNAKFLGRVVSYQIDINECVTEMYKKILTHSTDIPAETISKLVFKLSTPSALDSVNMADLVSNVENNVQFVIKAITGENAEQGEEDNIVKDLLFQKLAKQKLSAFDWELIEDMYKDAVLEAGKIREDKKARNEEIE